MAHMRHLVDQLHKLEERLRAGGGEAKIERQHRAGKTTALPYLGSVTGIGKIEGCYAVIIAGDATAKAGHRPLRGLRGPQPAAPEARAPPRGNERRTLVEGTLWLAR